MSSSTPDVHRQKSNTDNNVPNKVYFKETDQKLKAYKIVILQ